jgi:hypothetical protein
MTPNPKPNAILVGPLNKLIFHSYDVLSTPKLLSSSGPTDGRQHRAANGEGFCLCICPLSLLIAKFSERPAAVKGARVVRGGRKSFPGLKRFSAADP